MLLAAFNAIKNKLSADVAEIKLIDWFNDQYSGTIHTVPAVFVEFPVPLKLKTHRVKFQTAPLIVRIHAVSKALSDQSKKLKPVSLQQHEQLVQSVYHSLHGFGASYASDGKKLFTSLNRFDLTHHQYIKGWLMTTQDFEAQIHQHFEETTGTIDELEVSGQPKYNFDS